MKFEFTGRHIEVTEPIRKFVEDHFERIGYLFEKEDTFIHVTIGVEKMNKLSEIVVKWRNQVIAANSSDEDMYHSLALTIDKVEKQVHRIREKMIDRTHHAEKLGEIVAEDA